MPGDEENQAPAIRRTKASIQITEDHTEELSKNPEDELSVSEKILLESASEKDRVSEVIASIFAAFSCLWNPSMSAYVPF